MKSAGLSVAIVCGTFVTAGLLRGQSDRLMEPIDNGAVVSIAATIPSGAQAVYDIGAIDPATVIEPVTLFFKPSVEQQTDLSQLLDRQRNPLSTDYRRWLSPFEFADRFGLSASDLKAITDWLAAQGLSIRYTANGRNWIAFSGSAAKLEQVFHTPIHSFRINGQTHFANTANLSIPAALAGIVSAVRGLDDFHPKPFSHRSQRMRTDLTLPDGSHYLAPGDMAAIYDFNPLYGAGIDGTGQKIVIAGQTDVYLSDIASFRQISGLPDTAPELILFGADPGVSADDLVEADLDLEWSGAAAPNAGIVYVYSTDVFSSVFYAIDQWPVLAPVISLSYGGCEQQNRTYLNQLRSAAQQANAAGITWVASSGDTGAAACDAQDSSEASGGLAVNVPASIPEVTAVGGSEFNENGGSYWNAANGKNLSSAIGYIPEVAWNDSVQLGILNASGGGVSVYYPAPIWQTGAGFPNDGYRDVPDVALSASAWHDGYVFCTGGECANEEMGVVGGTSVGTPIFAGILALLNQYLTANGSISPAGLGNVNPALYQLAVTTPWAFHDISGGSNVVPCASGSANCSSGSYGYSAGPGYDQVTGLGSVDVYNLVTSWAAPAAPGQAPSVVSDAASAVSSTSATLGGSVNANGLDSQTWFAYGTDSSMAGAVSTPATDAGAGTSSIPVSFDLAGLTAATTYYFQAGASNAAGTSYGAILSFTTAPATQPNELDISAAPMGGGVVQPVSGQEFAAGSTVAITAAQTTGWTFAGWTGAVANASSAATTVVMNGSQSVIANFLPQQFSDVPPESSFFDAINLLYARGVTSGCSPSMYCPDDEVTRAQMAIFIVRSVYGGDNFTLNQQSPYFTDVPEGSFGYNWIQKMYELGITTGCTVGYYCPNNSVTRAEMAAFIMRMRYGGAPFTFSYSPMFSDVPSGAQFFNYIQRMAADNITSGCGSGMYCPEDAVTRGEMAVFIMRGAFNWLLPVGTPEIVAASPSQIPCCSGVTVLINGANTHFVQGVTSVVALPGITWSNLVVSNSTVLSVVLNGSLVQPEPVFVQTGSEQAVLPNGLVPASQ